MGKLFRLADGAGTSGSYESPVHDSGSVARWGRITWRGSSGGQVQVATRSGNSARPDKTWSDWSAPLSNCLLYTSYRVDKTGKAETYYETGQSHVTALAVDSRGNVLAGTEPNGLLYRISAKDKAFVLYNANLPEIRSIIPLSLIHI